MAGNDVVVDLVWQGDLRFEARVGDATFTMDSSGKTAPSPVDALVSALAGCMAIDLALILTRGRHPLTGLRTHTVAHRRPTDPKCIERVDLHFDIEGAVPPAAIQRAIDLSRDNYCSVWHSLRSDITLQVTFAVAA